MTTQEIYIEITNHMLQGVMLHEQLVVYYKFLNLNGYSKQQEYHYLQELKTYNHTVKHYIEEYNSLLPEATVELQNLIPNNWYRHTRLDVDAGTKRTSVKSGIQSWHDWEISTKTFYEEKCGQLDELHDYDGVRLVTNLIHDVSKEIKEIDMIQINKKATDYNISEIINEQYGLCKLYKEKISCIW